VAPVAQGGNGDADDVGDLRDGEQFVVAPALSDTLVVLLFLFFMVLLLGGVRFRWAAGLSPPSLRQ